MGLPWLRLTPTASRLLVVALVAAAVLAHGGSARAQAPIHLSGIEVTSRFPDGILFTLSVAGSQDIASIALHYHVLGERAARYDRLDFQQSPSVTADLLVRTETADRYIPPGAEIEYWVEIEDAAGARLETEPQRFVLLDPRFTWRGLDGDGGSILYHGDERDRAQRVLQSALDTTREMGALMGVSVEGPLRITLYNDWAEMRTALPPRSQVQEESLITEGVSFGDTGVILVLGSVPDVEGVTAHETTHFLMQQAMGGLSRLVPAWLNEGLAEYANPRPSSSYTRALERAIDDGRLLPLSSLTRPPGRPEDVILFYGESESAVTYLVDEYGPLPLQSLLQQLREGAPIDDALGTAYRLDRDRLEVRWRRSIGAPPPEAATTERSLPTRIPRPTVVPFGAEQTPAAVSAAEPEPTEPAASTGGCGRSTGARSPMDLVGVAPGLGLVALVGLWRASRRRPGDDETMAIRTEAQEDAEDLASHREAMAEAGEAVEATKFFRNMANEEGDA